MKPQQSVTSLSSGSLRVSRSSITWLPAVLLILGFLAAPVTADWLVTQSGDRIETEGPWSIADQRVQYLSVDGEIAWLPLEDVDLRASVEATKAEQPKVTLYMTSWCGYCRKARKLLADLDVEYSEKDIERDPANRREYLQRGRGYTGIPLLDIDGSVVRGYNEELITQLVMEMQKRQADESG